MNDTFEPVSLTEAVAKGDELLRDFTGGGRPLATWVDAENAARAAAKAEFEAAVLDVPGGPLVPGQWYDVTQHGEYSINVSTWRICRYVEQRRERSWQGTKTVYVFERWGAGAEKDPWVFGKIDTVLSTGLVSVQSITPGPKTLAAAAKQAAR